MTVVTPGVAAGGGDQRHPHAEVTRVERQHAIRLVVWVRCRLHQRAHRIEPAERQQHAGGAGQV